MNNKWIYFAPYSDSVTILCDKKEPVDHVVQGVGKLCINSGCKGFSASALLQASYTIISNVSSKEVYIYRSPPPSMIFVKNSV